MATLCPVCGQRLSRKARVCGVCGEPISAGDKRTSILSALAPTAGLQQDLAGSTGSDAVAAAEPNDTARPRRVRLLMLAGVVVVGLALSATYVALRSAPPRVPDGAAYGVVGVSAGPKLRWQHPLAKVAPDLGCPTVVESTHPVTDACVVTASATAADVVVVSVQRSQQAELIGVSRADGALRWHRRAPAGSTYDCMALNKRLWCLTVPLNYQAIDGSVHLGGAYRGAVLTGLNPTTGGALRSSAIPGSTAGTAFAGVESSGFYVLSRGSNFAGTLVRFSVNGEPQWNHQVTLLQPRWSFSSITGQVAAPQVNELGGRALVSLGEVDGRQAVFAVQGGTPIRSAPGHVVTVIDGAVVTQVGSGPLSIGDRTVAGNAVPVLAADDRSTGEPVLTTRFFAPATVSTDQAPTTGFVTRVPTDPIHDAHRLPAGQEPVAYCAGVIVTTVSNVFTGYNPTSGTRLWVAVADGENTAQIRCTHDSVVITHGYRARAFSLKTGKQVWTVLYPNGSTVTDSGYGDPQDGMVAGPAYFQTSPSTSLSYLR